MRRILLTVLLTGAIAVCSHADPLISLTLLPGATVAAPPGSAAGWGFVITNSGPDWIVLTGSAFDGNPDYGAYVDYLSQTSAPFYVIGPAPESSTVTQTWNPSFNPPLGLGEFDLYATDPIGTQISGTMTVSYDMFSMDPNAPNFDPNSYITSGALPVQAQVNVSPEPATAWMLGIALLPLAFLCRRKKRT